MVVIVQTMVIWIQYNLSCDSNAHGQLESDDASQAGYSRIESTLMSIGYDCICDSRMTCIVSYWYWIL